MEYKHDTGLVATYDYGTAEKTIATGDKEPIYVYKDDQLTENNITMSIEEAKWLIEKLQSLVDKFEKNQIKQEFI